MNRSYVVQYAAVLLLSTFALVLGTCALFADECPGGWFEGPCYRLKSRPCAECIEIDPGYGTGKCTDTACGTNGEGCQIAAAVKPRAGGVLSNCPFCAQR